jgi:hypothetical protein
MHHSPFSSKFKAVKLKGPSSKLKGPAAGDFAFSFEPSARLLLLLSAFNF